VIYMYIIVIQFFLPDNVITIINY